MVGQWNVNYFPALVPPLIYQSIPLFHATGWPEHQSGHPPPKTIEGRSRFNGFPDVRESFLLVWTILNLDLQYRRKQRHSEEPQLSEEFCTRSYQFRFFLTSTLFHFIDQIIILFPTSIFSFWTYSDRCNLPFTGLTYFLIDFSLRISGSIFFLHFRHFH